MATQLPCKKNDAGGYTFYISLVSQANTKTFQANPTLAAGDFKIAVDDAAPGNMGTLPVVDADFTKRVKVVLSQAETNGDNITIIGSDAAGAEWCDITINIQTAARQLDDHAFPTTSGRSIDVTATGAVGIDWANVEAPTTVLDLSGTSIASVNGAVASVTGAVGSVTGAVGSVSGAVGSVTGAVGSVTGLTASDVGAIKTQTDKLTFTVANQVDANIQYVNDVLVTGTGAVGNEWGP
jgi:hypothetical protein